MKPSTYWETTCRSPAQEFPNIWNLKLITVFARPRHWSLPWATRMQPTPSIIIALRLTLILSSHLPLGLTSSLSPFEFLTETFHAFLLSPMRSTFPSYLILLGVIVVIIFGEGYKTWSFSLCSSLQPSVTSTPLKPNLTSHTTRRNDREHYSPNESYFHELE